MRAHDLVMLVEMAAFRDVSVHVLHNDWVRWTDVKRIYFGAFSQEEVDSMFVTNFKPWIHPDAFSVPEGVEIWLAEPLVATLNMVLVLGSKLYTLVMLDMVGQLFEGDHGLTKQSVLLSH